MKNQYIKRALVKAGLCLSLLAVSASSCKLDEFNPAALSEQNTISNFAGWKAFQTNCYTGLWGSLIGLQYGLVSEVGTDLWTFSYNNHNQYKDVMAYEGFTNTSGIINNVWTFAWGSIEDCNKAIQLAPTLSDASANAADIKVLVAEAKVLRAYYYTVIVTQFGSVPLMTTDDPNKTLSPTRTPVAQIYAQIISDLTTAAADLDTTPYQNNAARVTKKAALGLLARAYAQGAGEGLQENGKSYWQRAKEVCDDLINNKAAYNAAMYDDFAQVFASVNNRNNIESLFTAYGLNPYDPSYDVFTGNTKPNLYLHYYPKLDDAFGTADVFKRSVNSNTSNGYYGRLNQQFVAPTKYLINCFNANYDKRWENTFVTAFANYSGVQAINSLGSGAPAPANVTYAAATVTLTAAMCTKYGIDASHVGQKIYPYADVNAKNASQNATWQYIPMIWNKGDHTGNATTALSTIPNANVTPYPLDPTDDRFFVYLSKTPLTAADKATRVYATVNIDDMFDPSDPTGSTYKAVAASNGLPNGGALANLFPAMMKFNHNFDGGWLGGNFQQKLGNIMVMRMAEVYLIAAECCFHGAGSATDAANYLNVLRKRACRNPADFNTATGMQLTTATQNDVFDEYARELCGEFSRWALLKREKAFETRLATYNKTAAVNFVPAIHYNRPIPFAFLNTITNAGDFGTNGYQ
ncbi:SusD-like starch-binding protein associating with outer membrane [Mucilaginibacter yixingensis]|uniref:SusD-like starch-binding protein associating with outer membrane n=1 Tax=Mucilaginibacter yixingensis TaxID=1295612 RepID=A0A2T5JCB0_9SPHI|nr:RagB/SusD family nutrient uptake outer membrane protein [Mucilaginibacter yixingensis]PTQ99400.1 SusD-like starch-binding protein associating with outer membrane [Mucilaginibacter yixingensis]